MTIDPVQLATELIQCPSVTPIEAGALDLLQTTLEGLGFTCTRLPFEEEADAEGADAGATQGAGETRVDNLYARLGTQAPHFCFAGHTDVVPVGDAEAWSHDPFAGVISDGHLWGRGAADMKGAIAAFIGAVSQYLDSPNEQNGSISLLITGDEEGPALNGTVKMLDWLSKQGDVIDDCLVGEPTNPQALGDMIKIGRRGSINGVVSVKGTQGHVAYPTRADNPVPHLIRLMNVLSAAHLDDGTQHFQPSNLEITSFDVGNATTNVIPAMAQARFNIRYNDGWNRETISAWIEETLQAARGETDTTDMSVKLIHSGESFLTQTGALTDLVSHAVENITGRKPELSTTGGTSDARFITNYARVVEFGLCGQTMHQVDERVAIGDIEKLTEIYTEILRGYFTPS